MQNDATCCSDTVVRGMARLSSMRTQPGVDLYFKDLERRLDRIWLDSSANSVRPAEPVPAAERTQVAPGHLL